MPIHVSQCFVVKGFMLCLFLLSNASFAMLSSGGLKDVRLQLMACSEPRVKNKLQKVCKEFNVLGSKQFPDVYHLACINGFCASPRDTALILVKADEEKNNVVIDNVLKNAHETSKTRTILSAAALGKYDLLRKVLKSTKNRNHHCIVRVRPHQAVHHIEMLFDLYIIAAKNKSMELLELITEYKCDIYKKVLKSCEVTPLFIASYMGDSNRVKELSLNHSRETIDSVANALIVSIRANDAECIKYLIKMTIADYIPLPVLLDKAMMCGNKRAFRALIAAKNPNELNKPFHMVYVENAYKHDYHAYCDFLEDESIQVCFYKKPLSKEFVKMYKKYGGKPSGLGKPEYAALKQ